VNFTVVVHYLVNKSHHYVVYRKRFPKCISGRLHSCLKLIALKLV